MTRRIKKPVVGPHRVEDIIEAWHDVDSDTAALAGKLGIAPAYLTNLWSHLRRQGLIPAHPRRQPPPNQSEAGDPLARNFAPRIERDRLLDRLRAEHRR